MKWLLLWTPSGSTTIAAFAGPARRELIQRLRGIPSVTLHLTERTTPRFSIVPYARRPLAMISIRGERALLDTTLDRMRGLAGTLAGYAVAESTPIARARIWPLEQRSPGVCMLTVFRRNPRLDRAQFFSEWYGRHTPMAMAIHPTVGYSRNAVEDIVVPGSTPWEGLVTEDFATEQDVLEPVRLFGGLMRAVPNMIRVGLHASSFLDLHSLENHLVAEYILAD